MQWGSITYSSKQNAGIKITFPQTMANTTYTFLIFGSNKQFGTSTDETAIETWIKYTTYAYYSKQQRDIPGYYTLEWLVVGKAA